MLEENEKKTFLVIEDNINNCLSGDVAKLALDFVSFLESNEMMIELNMFWNQQGNFWFAKYKGIEGVCFILVDGSVDIPGSWEIFTGESDESAPECNTDDEKLKAMAWQHINFCGGADCGGICSPGTQKTILGKEFDNVCGSAMAFHNPNAETVGYVKKLMMLVKSAIDKTQIC